jgi:hypothetical protein
VAFGAAQERVRVPSTPVFEYEEQMEAHLPVTEKVAGSTPVILAKWSICRKSCFPLLYKSMEKQELEICISKQMTQKQLAGHFGVSQGTVRYWLARYELKTLNQRYGGHGSKGFIGCRKCGEQDESKFYKKGKFRHHVCKSCQGKRRLERLKANKLACVQYKGGKCQKCGYSKCVAALDFHHRDSIAKDPDWNGMHQWNFEKVKVELDKCDLLCSNCHRELHFEEIV